MQPLENLSEQTFIVKECRIFQRVQVDPMKAIGLGRSINEFDKIRINLLLLDLF